jgi:hypothetical protein
MSYLVPAMSMKYSVYEADTCTILYYHIKGSATKYIEKLREDDLKEITKGSMITFQSGKGVNRIVPLIFPKDSHAVMKLIENSRIRTSSYCNAKSVGGSTFLGGWGCNFHRFLLSTFSHKTSHHASPQFDNL